MTSPKRICQNLNPITYVHTYDGCDRSLQYIMRPRCIFGYRLFRLHKLLHYGSEYKLLGDFPNLIFQTRFCRENLFVAADFELETRLVAGVFFRVLFCTVI